MLEETTSAAHAGRAEKTALPTCPPRGGEGAVRGGLPNTRPMRAGRRNPPCHPALPVAAKVPSAEGFPTDSLHLYGRGAGKPLLGLFAQSPDTKRAGHRPACFRMSSAGIPRFVRNLGGAKEGRTPDLLNAIQTLYQLSYSPMVRLTGGKSTRTEPPRQAVFSSRAARTDPAAGKG